MTRTLSYLDQHGKLNLGYQHTLTNEDLIRIYSTMVKTRCVDQRMILLQRQGLLPFVICSKGEEACAVASAAALETADWMYPQYRELGIMFWRGYSIQNYIHHMLGNQHDPNKGRQLSNHFGSKELNVVTVSCPVGTQIPQAAGCAYGMKISKEKRVVIVYFGEGTTSQGDFHVGVNFAAVRKAPVIFFCRNNGYAISTPTFRQFSSEGIAPKGIGYGIKTMRVDGNDVFAVYESVKEARSFCLEGKGPVLIEAMTYRLGPHSTSDNCSIYRKKDELCDKEAFCPILRLKHYLIQNHLWDDHMQEQLLDSLTNEINHAIKVAKGTPLPSFESMFENVYF